MLTPHLEVIAPEASISEAAQTMNHLEIGPLPVCEGERLVGMLTDRAIAVRGTLLLLYRCGQACLGCSLLLHKHGRPSPQGDDDAWWRQRAQQSSYTGTIDY
jgi:hypothetical protein